MIHYDGDIPLGLSVGATDRLCRASRPLGPKAPLVPRSELGTNCVKDVDIFRLGCDDSRS